MDVNEQNVSVATKSTESEAPEIIQDEALLKE